MKGRASDHLIFLLFCTLFFQPLVAWSKDRNLVIVIDSSSSMQDNDKAHYTLQTSQILSDLTDDEDHLSIVDVPDSGSCESKEDLSLAIPLETGKRQEFKEALRSVKYSGGTTFTPAIRTGLHILGQKKDQKRMLLIIADAEGFGSCDAFLRDELMAFRRSGGMVAAINIQNTKPLSHYPVFDMTIGAKSSVELLHAVGRVYQVFLGSHKIQHGLVQNNKVDAQIATMTKEAYLIVASDGPMHDLQPEPNNPAANRINLNFNQGGWTKGEDRKVRNYRIVHITRPMQGTWRFIIPELMDHAGWMLLQESSLGARIVSSPILAANISSQIKVELYDQDTGRRVDDPQLLSAVTATVQVDGKNSTLQPSTSGGGSLEGQITVPSKGKINLTMHLSAPDLDRVINLNVEAVDSAWQIQVDSPQQVTANTPTTLRAHLRLLGVTAVPPKHLQATLPGETLLLNRVKNPAQNNEITYEGVWTPKRLGTENITFENAGTTDVPTPPVTWQTQVLGDITFDTPKTIIFPEIRGNAESQEMIDITGAKVNVGFDLQVFSNFQSSTAQLEVNFGQGWTLLNAQPQLLRVDGHVVKWPLRLKTGVCPTTITPNEPFQISLRGVNANGQERLHVIQLVLTVTAEPWLYCVWPVIALVFGGVLAIFIFYGVVSPSRFSSGLGITLGDQDNLPTEGFFTAFASCSAAHSGFYRDAQLFLHENFILSGKKRRALVRLRAHRGSVYLLPLGSVLVKDFNNSWTVCEKVETMINTGTVYCNEMKTIYFSLDVS